MFVVDSGLAMEGLNVVVQLDTSAACELSLTRVGLEEEM